MTDQPSPAAASSPLEGHPVPSFHGPSSTGATLRLESFLGKVPMAICVVGDAVQNARVLERLGSQLHDFGERRVQLLVIAKETAAGVRKLADDHSLNVPVIADPDGSTAAVLGAEVHTPPFAILVDSAGRVRKVVELTLDGGIADDLLALVDAATAADPSAFEVLPIDLG